MVISLSPARMVSGVDPIGARPRSDQLQPPVMIGMMVVPMKTGTSSATLYLATRLVKESTPSRCPHPDKDKSTTNGAENAPSPLMAAMHLSWRMGVTCTSVKNLVLQLEDDGEHIVESQPAEKQSAHARQSGSRHTQP